MFTASHKTAIDNNPTSPVFNNISTVVNVSLSVDDSLLIINGSAFISKEFFSG